MDEQDKTPGDHIREAREARGWSQADLARQVGISQPAIKKIEASDTLHSKFLPRIAQLLDLDLAVLDRSLSGGLALPGLPTAAPFGDAAPRAARDFPVYASVEGGPGEIIVSDAIDFVLRPGPLAHVRGAYGLLVVGTSMEPEYRPGDTALVNPRLPVIGGEVYIFYSEREGEARATIKHLRRATADKWQVTQHNPPPGSPRDFALLRKEWQWAHRVQGKYSRQ